MNTKIRFITKHLLFLFVGFVLIVWSLKLTQWLTPATSDVRLSFEQTSPLQNAELPQEALDNHMPQLGKAVFLIDGLLMKYLGPMSPYILRYTLFGLSLWLLFGLFRKRFNSVDPTLFFITISCTFFFSIKFFFWLDYLFVIPIALWIIHLILKEARGWKIFALTLVAMYIKMSSPYIVIIFMGMFVPFQKARLYLKYFGIAVVLSVAVFLLKWGLSPFSDRGHSGPENLLGYSLMGINLQLQPWLIFSIFSKAHQSIITDISFILLLKTLLILGITIWLLITRTAKALFPLACIFFAYTCSLLIIRDHPTLHDFATYNGIIELGLVGIIWLSFEEVSAKWRRVFLFALFTFFLGQILLWNKSFKALTPEATKLELIGKLQSLTTNKSLYLFCSWNVGEFEYYLKDTKIHYLLSDNPIDPNAFNQREKILLIPEQCQHEKMTTAMKFKHQSLLKALNAKFIERVNIDQHQSYILFEAQ